MKKAQVVSMDFIMTFVVYIFALSLFFFALKTSVSYSQVDLDIQAELVFNRLDQIYVDEYDFLDGAKVNKTKLDNYLNNLKDPLSYYDFVFKDFENSAYFEKMYYCVYLENSTGINKRILRNFAAYSRFDTGDIAEKYPATFPSNVKCGVTPFQIYSSAPECNNKNMEAVVLSKPVLYDQEIINLKVLICAKRRV